MLIESLARRLAECPSGMGFSSFFPLNNNQAMISKEISLALRMTYSEWNEHLAELFFNSENAGRDIHFYLTKQDLIKHNRSFFNGKSDDEIWSNFINAIKYGQQNEDECEFPYSPIKRPLELYENWNKKDIPPFIAYLLLYIIPLTESYDEHFNAINYYGKVNVFFYKNGILNEFTEQSIVTGNFRHISHLWTALEEWSILTKSCDLGIFELKKFGNRNWIYVGKPFSQCVLPPSSINKLPEFFFEAGLIPKYSYSNEEFRKTLLKLGSKILWLKESVIDLIRCSDSNELGQSIIEIVIREYHKWTGETHEIEEDGGPQRTKRNYTVASLFLQFRLNENDGTISFSFRIYSQNVYPEDLKFDDHENLNAINGWSKTLTLDFKEPIELKDDFNKWVARFPIRDVRLFVSAGTFQLSSSYWIENEVLSRTSPMFLLCNKSTLESIVEWGKTFRNGDFIQEDLEGLPENYSLFKLRSPTISHPNIPLLTLYTEKKIELIGGLKVNFRTYINDFLPIAEISNSEGNEKVYLQYRHNKEKIFLIREESSCNRWFLPSDILVDTDFYIKVEDENFKDNEFSYNLVGSGGSANKVDGKKLPKRDSYGRHIESDETQYCLGSNVINPMRASQHCYCPWESLFLSINEESVSQIATANINNHCGNMLSGFLSLKGILTTEEFFHAFEYYYEKEYSDGQASENFNLTRAKKASLNFYDYTGILDYDYETKKIVVNSPQLIFIPSDKGRKVLLIGARDSSLVNSIIDSAPKYDLQVEITGQFPSNAMLLIPDAVTIKSYGNRKEGYGIGNLTSLANELNIPFTKSYYAQIALQLFSAEISEFENELLLKKETSQEDYGWARRIFNHENLCYERNESSSFDKSFSLVEYKLNEYTFYHKLWMDGKCYLVDKNWGRYLALKRFKKDVILFDSQRKRVAIPWETPLPRLLSESIMLLSGLAPNLQGVDGRYYRVFENIPGIFTENLFRKLGQRPINRELK